MLSLARDWLAWHWQYLLAAAFGIYESWSKEAIMDTSNVLLAPVRELLDRCCYRNELKNTVTASRLGKMLSRKGVDLHYYLYSQSSSEIERQMRNCMHCHSLDECDCYLEIKEMDRDMHLAFCRNSDAIHKIRDQQESLYVNVERTPSY